MTGLNLSRQTGATSSAIRRNVEAVGKLEEDFLRNRTAADRVADAIADFSGSLPFIALHVAVFGAWIALNLIPGVRRFDPFPFMLLSVVVSIEAIFLSTFVLIKQNRMSKRADQRAHLDLQINLLAEREMTLVLQMLQRISVRLGVNLGGEEVREARHKQRLIRRLPASEHVVEVRNMETYTELRRKSIEHRKQADRIRAARNGDKDPLSRLQHAESVDGQFNFNK